MERHGQQVYQDVDPGSSDWFIRPIQREIIKTGQ